MRFYPIHKCCFEEVSRRGTWQACGLLSVQYFVTGGRPVGLCEKHQNPGLRPGVIVTYEEAMVLEIMGS